MVNTVSSIYNHCIALHTRYYAMFGQHLNVHQLQKHIAKKRKSNPFWQLVGSQAVQDIFQQIERAYQLFFKHHSKGVRPPTFKKRIKYKSFTLKQAGYKFLGGGRLKIGQRVYRYWNSREIEGKVKTVTVKCNRLGEFCIYVVTDAVHNHQQPLAGQSAGFDFGLKTFLTVSDGSKVESPLFLRQGLKQLQSASRALSHKAKGSKNREQARQHLARVHEQIAHQRQDWFWKLSRDLTERYDHLYFETLNLKGIQKLWGRKISDLAFAEFLKILEFVAFKKGKVVSYIDLWYPSTKTCTCCGHQLEALLLEVRRWRCPSCQSVNGQDVNAAVNIEREGASSRALGDVRQA